MVHYLIGALSEDPEKQGEPLLGKLAGLRSVHTAGRYRIIYQVDREQVIVIIVGAGIRKEGAKRDIYALARKLLHAGVIEATVRRKPRKK